MKDHYPGDIWETKMSQIISIHLLARAFLKHLDEEVKTTDKKGLVSLYEIFSYGWQIMIISYPNIQSTVNSKITMISATSEAMLFYMNQAPEVVKCPRGTII